MKPMFKLPKEWQELLCDSESQALQEYKAGDAMV